MLNRVVIMGRLCADPELRYTPSNVPVATITIAVDRNYTRQGEKREADFFDVVTWRHTAEFVSKYFSKGDMIAVDGHLQTRKWKDKHDQNRVAVEIQADDVSFAGQKKSNDGGTSGAAQPAGAYGAPYSVPPESDFSGLYDDEDTPF